MARTRHDVFRMRLQMHAFLPIERLWTLRLYDGTPQATIERTEDAIAASTLATDRLNQELMYKHFCDCSVEIVHASDDPDVPHTYSCRLYVVKCNANGETSIRFFSLVLSPSDGISGTYYDSTEANQDSDKHDESEVIAHVLPDVAWWQAVVEPVRLSLAPLTCGKYTVGGVIFDDEVEGVMTPAVIHLELLPEGELVGRSEEYIDEDGPEMVELSGSWTSSSIEIVKVYRLEDGARDVYLYRGTVSRFGYTGHWVNVEEDEDVADIEVELAQCFDLHVTKMQRRWSPEEHSIFPEDFREAVKLCLLSSLGPASLPNVLWLLVFEYCDSNWFT